MKKKILILLAAIIMMTAVSGCPSAAPSKTSNAEASTSETAVQAANTVIIENHAFNPGVLTIKAGDSVTWTNKDSVSHSVVFADFESGLLKKDDSYTHTFDKAGTFKYNCGPHPDMLGTIEVQ